MKKSLIILLLYLLIFTILFSVSIFNYYQQKTFFEVGLPGQTTNFIMIFLSIAGIAKSVWHIISY